METRELVGNEGAESKGEEALAQARDIVIRADERIRTLVAEHPVGTLLGAAAIGYLLGRLILRR